MPAGARAAFEGAVRGIRTLQRQGVPATVRVTIHRHNVHHLAETAAFILEDLGLRSFSTNAAGYLGACQLRADTIMLTTTERQTAIETLLALAETYPGRIGAQAGPLAEGRTWRRMEQARAGGAAAFANGGRLTACGCLGNQISVLSDGAIVPCVMLAHVALGRINQDALGTVWRESPALKALRGRQRDPFERFQPLRRLRLRALLHGQLPRPGLRRDRHRGPSQPRRLPAPFSGRWRRAFMVTIAEPAAETTLQAEAGPDCAVAQIGSVPQLGSIYFYLTEGCNLACRHCWLAPRHDPQGTRYATLPLDLAAAIIEEARPLGLSSVKLTGGEPLLHPQFSGLVDMVQRAGLKLTVETNGTLCTPALAARIAGAGRPFVSVSLDGADAATHEWVRGVPGSFALALQGIRNLVAAGIRPQIIMSLMRQNAGQVTDLVRLAEETGRGIGEVQRDPADRPRRATA